MLDGVALIINDMKRKENSKKIKNKLSYNQVLFSSDYDYIDEDFDEFSEKIIKSQFQVLVDPHNENVNFPL